MVKQSIELYIKIVTNSSPVLKVGSNLFVRVSGQLPPKKIAPRLWLWLGLVLGLGGNFPRG